MQELARAHTHKQAPFETGERPHARTRHRRRTHTPTRKHAIILAGRRVEFGKFTIVTGVARLGRPRPADSDDIPQ